MKGMKPIKAVFCVLISFALSKGGVQAVDLDKNPLTTVLFNDKTYATMLIDTGASMTTITPKFAQKLGIQITNETPRKKLHTVNGIIHAPVVTIKSLRAGKCEIKNLEVVVTELGEGFFLPGFLGMNFLREQSFEIKESQVFFRKGERHGHCNN